jgi:hypothetical protein
VQQELIAEIQRTSMWPVVVAVDGNISIPEKLDFVDRDGSYIILVPNGDFKTFVAEILGLFLRGDKLIRLWNSEARFVVAGANEFSMSQQMNIFHCFSRFRIYNCIIVSGEHDVVDTGMKLAVYSWFPYRSSVRCAEVNDITLLDSWVISAQGHFFRNTDLFPSKISKTLNGCPMKAIVRNSGWNLKTNYFNHTDSNGRVFTEIVGIEMDLFRIILKQMNMTLIHVLEIKGAERLTELVYNIFRAMITKEADIAFGDLVLGIALNSYYEFTNTYYVTNIRWYVPCFVKYPRWSSIFRVLSVELWVVLIISIVITAISITLVGRYSCSPEWQSYKTLTSSLTNIWAVILGVSLSTIPRTPSLRSLFLAWVCFSVAFSTVFQAFLTTFLIDSGYETPIRNMDELFDSGITLACRPGDSIIFNVGDETEASKVRRNIVTCPSNDICLDWATYHKNASTMLSENLVEEFYSLGQYVGENSKPLLCRLEDGVFFRPSLTMVMLQGDPLMRRVTEIVDRVVEAGIYNYWISLRMHWLKLLAQKIAIVDPLDGYYSFNLYHMQPAFYLLLMGWCVSTLCFLVEIFYNRVLSKIN